MKTVFTVAGLIGLWAFADNLPAALVTPVALIAITTIFVAATVALTKWVKNA